LSPVQALFAQALPGAYRIGIEAPSSNHDEGVPEQFERGPKVLRQVDDVRS